ncbi:unnamed protein product [Lactuca virosa]|uniref:Uncharacterized protein n=1 Tax=Lactuca virosa TaxID=75947 RepID=A0AAU9MT01_9ASTR|nr:unnamed protein product [Lactuca virosa]
MNHRWRLTDCSVYFRNVLSSEDISKPLKVFDEMSGLKNINQQIRCQCRLKISTNIKLILLWIKILGSKRLSGRRPRESPFFHVFRDCAFDKAAHLNKGIHKIYSCDATTVSS